MKTAFLPLFSLCLLLASCGVSSVKQEQMQTSLYNAMTDAFLAQDEFVAFAPSVELRDVEQGESPWSPADGYHGNFSCDFEDGEKRIHLVGAAGFNKNGSVAKIEDGRLAVEVIVVLEGSQNVSPSESIYNIPAFCSSRP